MKCKKMHKRSIAECSDLPERLCICVCCLASETNWIRAHVESRLFCLVHKAGRLQRVAALQYLVPTTCRCELCVELPNLQGANLDAIPEIGCNVS